MKIEYGNGYFQLLELITNYDCRDTTLSFMQHCLKSDSHLDEKCSFFHLKHSFRPQSLTFRPCPKKGLIRNVRLISKHKTSQPD